MRSMHPHPLDHHPATHATADAPTPPEPVDEGLHFGRAWHRYRYCFRQASPLRALDAGCGTGRSSVALATLNPAATVLGVDASAVSLDLARERAEGPGEGSLEFRRHDLTRPIPADWGRFDFVACRDVLGTADDPDLVLANLANALDPSGLLYVTFPSHFGRLAARSLRRAVDALAPPDAGLDERTKIGVDVFHALHHDHLIRLKAGAHADPERVVADALAGPRDWTLDEAVDALGRAGLTFLYAATPWRWRPDRCFAPHSLPDHLHEQLAHLAPDRLSLLIDALDGSLLDDEYYLYACPKDHIPALPDWVRTRRDCPETFDALIPRLTGLARPTRANSAAATPGRVIYQTVSGTFGELDRLAGLMLAAVDGVATCGEIERGLSARIRAGDQTHARQESWIDLADAGLILLQSPDNP